jgi:glucosamine-6-phosphate deaminase
MEVLILPRPEDCAIAVADQFTDAIARGARVLGLATGSSPLQVYAELIRRHREEGLSFAELSAFLLDEYVGLDRGHPASYDRFIRENFADHVDLPADRVHGPDGAAPDAIAEAARYDALLAAQGPVDIQLLGIGTNGHIGFNEPTSSLTSPVRAKTLADQTRHDNARFFDSVDEVPRHVITQGLGTITTSRRAVLIATGERKAAAVAAAVEGPVSAMCPASVLQLHPRAVVVVDEAAASRLRLREYYREVAAHKDELPGA